MVRLNKFLASAGVASRRQADRLIMDGRVAVNGEIVSELGRQVDPTSDRVLVDGKQIASRQSYQYLIMFKPPGYLTTVRDQFGRKTVLELLPKLETRLYPVGRLDLDTSGLLFFTNDGDMALALTHPRHLIEKVYQVKVLGIPSNEELQSLRDGIMLEDGMTSPAKVALEEIEKGNAIIRLTIREGKKRQVKRMMQAINHPVLKLHRLAVGPLTLGNLRPGETRVPTAIEMDQLVKLKEQILRR